MQKNPEPYKPQGFRSECNVRPRQGKGSIYPSARELGAYAERAPSNPVDIPLANPMLAKPNYIFNSHPVPFRSQVYCGLEYSSNQERTQIWATPLCQRAPPPTTPSPPLPPRMLSSLYSTSYTLNRTYHDP